MRIVGYLVLLCCTCIVLLSFSSVPAKASEPVVYIKSTSPVSQIKLSLAEAIAQAEAHNSEIVNLKEQLRISRLQIEMARIAVTAKLDFNTTWTYTDPSRGGSGNSGDKTSASDFREVSQVQAPNVDGLVAAATAATPTSGVRDWGRGTSFHLSQPFAFTAIDAHKALKNQEKAKIEELNAKRDEIRFNVTAAYMNVLLMQRNLSIAQTGVSLAETALKDSNARFDAGSAPKLDVMNAEADLAVANEKQSTVNSTINQLENALFLQLGMHPPKTQVVLDQSLIDNGDYLNSLIAKVEDSNIVDNNVTETPTYLNLMREIDVVTYSRRAYRQSPQYGLSLAWVNTDDPGSKDTWQANFTVNYRLFDAGASRNTRAQLLATRNILNETKDNFVRSIEAGVYGLQSKIVGLKTALDASERAVSASEEALRVTELGYREGVATFIQVQAARNRLLAAQEGLFANRVQLFLAADEIRKLLGYKHFPDNLEGLAIGVPDISAPPVNNPQQDTNQSRSTEGNK